jgi:hypothetical protein
MYFSKYSPFQLSKFFSFDASTDEGKEIVILNEDVNFESFQNV